MRLLSKIVTKVLPHFLSNRDWDLRDQDILLFKKRVKTFANLLYTMAEYNERPDITMIKTFEFEAMSILLDIENKISMVCV